MGEARRFYSVLALASNFAAIVAGQASIHLPALFVNKIPFISGKELWEQSQLILVTVVIACGIITMLIYRWINRNVLTDSSFDEFHLDKKELKAKGKLSFRESFTYLSNSKYLLCIAAQVVTYNLVINLVEVVWKDQLKLLYPDPKDFNSYLSYVTTYVGIVATIAAVFMAKLISRFGWTAVALITPVTMFVTCAGFFLFLFTQDSLGGLVLAVTGMTPLAIAVFFGAAQNCLSKAAKYSVFDATKEMTYIPLSHECKLKGKAAIDGVGSRFGKSGGSLILQGLSWGTGGLFASAPFVAGILGFVIILWIMATKSLGKQFNELANQVETKTSSQASQSKVVQTPA